MSATRVITGIDDRGRPKSEWRPVPGADAEPRYGHMEPAYDATIQRRQATPEELAAARAREAEPSHLDSPTRATPGVIVQKSAAQMSQPAPTIAARTAASYRPTPAPPPEEPSVSEPPTNIPEIIPDPLDRLALAAAEESRTHQAKEAADTAWDVAREALARAYAEVEDLVEPLPQPDDDHAHYILTVPVAVPEPAPIGGGPAPRRTVREPRTSGLSTRQALAIELMQAGHNRAEVARRMGTTYQTVDGLLEAAAKKKLLPIELIALLPARFAKYMGAEA